MRQRAMARSTFRWAQWIQRKLLLNEAIALGANDIGHLEEGPSHFFFSLRER